MVDTKASGVECERIERCSRGEEDKVQPVRSISLSGDDGIHPGAVNPDDGSGLRIDRGVGSGLIFCEGVPIDGDKNDAFGLALRTPHHGIDPPSLIIDSEHRRVIVL